MPERLTKIGFEDIGKWEINQGRIAYSLDKGGSLPTDANALYAFVQKDKVLYIGKTTLGLKKRLQRYLTPGKNKESTNKKCHTYISNELENGEIRLFVFASNPDMYHEGFAINLAAGLEDALVKEINPLLNGKQGSPKTTETKENEIVVNSIEQSE